MHLATIIDHGVDIPVIVDPVRGVIPVPQIDPQAPPNLQYIIQRGLVAELMAAASAAPDHAFRPREVVAFTAPYRHPRLIWGIGLNYRDHATDLSESVPEEPASFIKGDHTVIGPGDPIPIPPHSERTTSEAEMGIIIGKYCRNVEETEALDHVLGVCPVLDQTAEDILQRNPRFLTRSKNFPGFFSFGPEIVPLPEVLAQVGRIENIEVSTVVNDTEQRTNTVEHMRFSPAFLVSFHSKIMPLYPGDILSPGTPGALHIRPGDVSECRIPGVGTLRNPVVEGS
ncbi:fumarylacetoacetate hydrolase family protein [Cellulosimicrobium funkei]|nr:fumarylacetoacetate hydrolase family protein [Cellulosimicrobium funkei]